MEEIHIDGAVWGGGSFELDLVYGLLNGMNSQSQVEGVIYGLLQSSAECRQLFSYSCWHAPLFSQLNMDISTTYWVKE